MRTRFFGFTPAITRGSIGNSHSKGGYIDASQFYNYGGGIDSGNGPGWQVMWAEWGAGNRRANVTDRVRALLSGNGQVKVNNANMGGDPAVGADKTLWISARDTRPSCPGGPGPGYPGGPGVPGNLQITRAYYGLNNRTNDVTQRLRGMVQGNYLDVQVNNNNMGGDPAPGADKVLTVIYRINGGNRRPRSKKETGFASPRRFPGLREMQPLPSLRTLTCWCPPLSRVAKVFDCSYSD